MRVRALLVFFGFLLSFLKEESIYRGVAWCNVFSASLLHRATSECCMTQRQRCMTQRCIAQHVSVEILKALLLIGALATVPRTTHLPLSSLQPIKKDDWDTCSSFVKVPVRLVACMHISANAKVLWITLANQAFRKRSISKSALDRVVGVHRSTRIRLLEELIDCGLVSVSSNTDRIILNEPEEALDKLETQQSAIRKKIKEEILDDLEPISKPKQPKGETKAKPLTTEQACVIAAESWNQNRPKGYSKIRQMSQHVLKAVNMHMNSLNCKPNDYDEFFKTLKIGIEKSRFWSKENVTKSLQSITGVGNPTDKKFQNVHSLYNDGLEAQDPNAEKFAENGYLILPRTLQEPLEQYMWVQTQLSMTNDKALAQRCKPQILEIEQTIRDHGLDPQRFRRNFCLTSWPTDVEENTTDKDFFWTFEDNDGF